MTVVSKSGWALQYASEELRGDREVVMTAVSRTGWALRFTSEELRGDREIVMKAVSQFGWALEYASEELRGDREIVMTTVSHVSLCLQFASEELRGNREIVMKAVSKQGHSLAHATEELRGDREIVRKAMSQTEFALQYATEKLKGDHEFLEVAVQSTHLVVVKVRLLSGRCCTLIVPGPVCSSRRVLPECARLLDLDRDHVAATGTLLQVLRASTAAIQESTMPRKLQNSSPRKSPNVCHPHRNNDEREIFFVVSDFLTAGLRKRKTKKILGSLMFFRKVSPAVVA